MTVKLPVVCLPTNYRQHHFKKLEINKAQGPSLSPSQATPPEKAVNILQTLLHISNL